MLVETAELILSPSPDRAFMKVPGLSRVDAYDMAVEAVAEARRKMPKLTGASADRLEPIYEEGLFGMLWQDSYVWYQDHGIRPFTMNNLEGKTIPMWINDPAGALRMKNPKAKTRTTADGRVQTLIFRKVAKKGSRVQKYTRNAKTGRRELISDKPASYPGAPGRIGTRNPKGALSPDGARVGGQIAKGNVGVRWRHPGLPPKLFINNALTLTSQRYGILPVRVYVTDATWNGRIDK